VTSQLSAALRAAAAGIHPDEAGTGLIISHGVFLHRGDFTRYVETAACISDGAPMAWIDWGEAYGVEALRDDLARFTFLLGGSDGEDLFAFSPRALE
jgi:hypothetical protein